ncbi:insecticidal toxin complex protein TccC [Pseudomonas laurylsulfativorans]|uniref:RHS repeat domain-containing protein n=1 Tax=Pseudomonas laurylsulfativorans TaxID=1943631 RepID=UPI00209CBB40|nr:RHS repeat-associated core domain-containing protein [Pseudomonas laurylsulfativorans]MCP1419307.1 insecticidal toxin complex protein TccC [Pseudomonas laurylsulfativorans]
MNAHTPSISVVDPRGLAVRAVAYCRQAAIEPVSARVTHQVFDSLGRLVEQRDPRLFALNQNDASVPANLTTIHNLTGQALCSDSVDAGWQLGLPGAAGQALESWDQRGWHRRTEHDPLLRPVAVHEQAEGEPERCVERMTFGGASGDHAKHNRCGQPIRQDDPAGTRLLSDYGMSAAILGDVRHFLSGLNPVDWPVVEADRDPLLEPGNGARTWWTYAPSGELITQTDTKGHRQHFAHDQAGQLHSVGLQRARQQDVDTLVSSLHYSALGQVEHELADNGMRTTSAYDPADGRLLSLTAQTPDQRFLQKLSYGYDPTGNITEITDTALPIQHFANQRIEPVRRFTYDTLYQLISATGWESAKPSLGPALPEWQAFGPPDGSRWCNYSETYQYDEAGNLLQRIHQGAVGDTLTMRVAPLSNRSVKVHPTQYGVDESFDARGNLLELQPGQGLQWNGRNQLAQVTQVARVDGADDLERYAYDSEGTRLRKIRTSAAKSIAHTAEVRYLPGLELHSNSATGEQLQVVSVQAGRCTVRLLHWDSPPPAELENDQLRYCFDDHLGSSAFEVDAQAQVISQEVYYPFGGTAWLAGRHEVETGYKTIRYSGKERDATGLYYYGARYYAPWLQRWLNPDPAGDVDGVNFYRFVKNSPCCFFDPQGCFLILRHYFDYRFEKSRGIRNAIHLRGMKEFNKKEPDMAKKINESMAFAKKAVTTMAENISDKMELYGSYFGVSQSDHVLELKDSYHNILLALERVELKREKIVAFIDVDGPRKNVYAFVSTADRRGKIYMNYEYLKRASVARIAHALIHEASHQNKDKPTYDYYYLKSHDYTDDAEYCSSITMRSKKMLTGLASTADWADSFGKVIPVPDNFEVGAATQKYNEDSAMRSLIARNNADSLAGFAIVTSMKDGQDK